MSLCDKCISGVRHEGTPEGKVEVINGVKAYVATPTGDYPKDKAVLYLSDIFGIGLINAQLLADDFARNGFKVYAVDYLNNDAVPSETINSGTFDFVGWLANHGQDVTRPFIDKLITGLKAQGVTQFAAAGFCLGARYTFDLAFDKAIKVAAVSHPSLLKVPDDLEAFKKTGIPLLINSCESDFMFPQDAQAQADTILGSTLKAASFTVRGDMSDPKVKAAREGALTATVEIFLKHL